MRLLLAEDEKELSHALVTVLLHNNYSVDAVYNGQDALDYINMGNYDGAILDIMMPKMDGITVLKKVRASGNLIRRQFDHIKPFVHAIIVFFIILCYLLKERVLPAYSYCAGGLLVSFLVLSSNGGYDYEKEKNTLGTADLVLYTVYPTN